MASLFISYSRKDIEFARKLTESLEGQDLDFRIDWEGIPPSVDWGRPWPPAVRMAPSFYGMLRQGNPSVSP